MNLSLILNLDHVYIAPYDIDDQTSVEDYHQVEVGGKVQKIISFPFGQCQVFFNVITSPVFDGWNVRYIQSTSEENIAFRKQAPSL